MVVDTIVPVEIVTEYIVCATTPKVRDSLVLALAPALATTVTLTPTPPVNQTQTLSPTLTLTLTQAPTLTTPKAAAGPQNLWVSLNGLDYVDTGKEFLFYAFAIAKVSPQGSPVKGRQNVVVTGTGFAGFPPGDGLGATESMRTLTLTLALALALTPTSTQP